MANRPLTLAEIAAISAAVQGKSLTPDQHHTIDALMIAYGATPDDPNFPAVKAAYEAANHHVDLPPAASAPTLATTPTASLGPTQSVAAKIAAGGYAGAATNGSPPSVIAAQNEIKADQGPSDIPGQKASPSAWDMFTQGSWQPTLDFLAPQAQPSSSSPVGVQTGNPGVDAMQPQSSSWQAVAAALGGGSLPAGTPYHTGDTSTAWAQPGTPDMPDTVAASPLDPNVFGGYTFAKLNPSQRNSLLTDQTGPALEAAQLAQAMGGGIGTASNLTPYVQAAIALAPTGVLGGAVNNTSMGGPASSAYQLKAVEDFIRQANGPGGQVDPTTLTNATLDRLQNTPQAQFSKLASLGIPSATGAAGDQTNVNDQITATNNAMQAVAQLSYSPQSAQDLNKVLAMATIQYNQMLLADPTITMSYPAYLRTFIPQMFGSGG